MSRKKSKLQKPLMEPQTGIFGEPRKKSLCQTCENSTPQMVVFRTCECCDGLPPFNMKFDKFTSTSYYCRIHFEVKARRCQHTWWPRIIECDHYSRRADLENNPPTDLRATTKTEKRIPTYPIVFFY